MDNAEILNQMASLRLALAEMTDQLEPTDHAELLVACSIFIAGFDAMMSMRHD